MYKWQPKDLKDPFKVREGEKIIDIEKYTNLLKEYNIPFTDKQYEDTIKEFNKKSSD